MLWRKNLQTWWALSTLNKFCYKMTLKKRLRDTKEVRLADERCIKESQGEIEP